MGVDLENYVLINLVGSSKSNDISTNLTYYNLYCAIDNIVARERTMIGTLDHQDRDYNKRVVSFIADIVGRLLWRNCRIHTVVFAKSDQYDRDCFILYSRQAETTPHMMMYDSFYCRRHDSD